MAAIAEEKFVSLTTFTKDGRPKPVPVWIVALGENAAGKSEVGFTTGDNSWKMKRIGNTPRITLQACDQRGNVTAGAPVVEGTARKGTTAEFEQIAALVSKKYGIMVPVIKFVGIFRKMFKGEESANSAVVIELAE